LEDSERIGSLLESVRPNAVAHLAWYVHPRDYLTSRENLRSLAATVSFAERVFLAGCTKLVAMGSGLEYSPSDQPRTEDDKTDPWCLYSASKIATGAVLRALATSLGAECAWARLFHVHGPGEDPRRLLPTVARLLAGGRPVDLTPGLQVRDHLDVADVASALVSLTDSHAVGVYNVCSGVGVTLKEVLTSLGEAVGRTDLLRFGALPSPPAETQYIVGDPTRLRQLGWHPEHSNLRASLARAVTAYLAPASL
jgi:dTDP-6-deoxy-L-talose 4-dehydrogenase (NAD+)